MMKKSITLNVISIGNLKTLKHHTFFDKTLVLSVICDKCGTKNEKIFKEEEETEILKILDLIKNMEKY